MFEKIMDGRGLFMDSTDWRELRYASHVKWLEPLLKLGCIERTGSEPAWPEGVNHAGRPQFNYHNFKVAPGGIAWWAKERVADHEKNEGHIRLELLVEPRCDGSLPIAFQGIGTPIAFTLEPEIEAAVKGIRDGYVEFLGHDNGHPKWWRMGESLTVALTKSGMEHFDSLPKLALECA
jgi:hypothetical protein